MAWVTSTKGANNHRLRVYAIANINEDITAGWLTYANGTIVVTLKISAKGGYTTGDLRVNATVAHALATEKLVVIIASKSFPLGAVGGFLWSRPGQTISVLSAPQVVGSASTSSSVGLGLTYLTSTALVTGLPLDLVQQDQAFINGLVFSANVIFNISSGVTTVTYNGPANSTTTGPVLVTLTNGNSAALAKNFTNITADFFASQFALTYLQVNTATFPNGAIRGAALPLLARTRRAIPYSVETLAGTFSAPNGLDTLRYPNQEGNEKNFGSFVSLTSTQATPGSNFTFSALFKFPAAASRRNLDLIRALRIELNLRLFGVATWEFDWFNAATGGYVAAATFSTTGQWTSGFADYTATDANTFSNNKEQLIVRVSVNAATVSTLWIDLFGIRSYEPSSFTNQALKPIFLQIGTLATDS